MPALFLESAVSSDGELPDSEEEYVPSDREVSDGHDDYVPDFDRNERPEPLTKKR